MPLEQLFPLLVGPGGAIIVLSIAVWQLWKSHQREDQRKDNLLDRQTQVIEGFGEATREQTETIRDALNIVGERRSPTMPVRRTRRTTGAPKG